MDEVIAHADEVKGKMGENLRAHIDDALLSRKVATIRTDAPVELDFDETSFPAFSADEVSAALGALGITAMQNRFLSLIGGEGGAAATVSTFEIPAVSRAAAGDARRSLSLPPRFLARSRQASGLPLWWTMTKRRARFLA